MPAWAVRISAPGGSTHQADSESGSTLGYPAWFSSWLLVFADRSFLSPDYLWNPLNQSCQPTLCRLYSVIVSAPGQSLLVYILLRLTPQSVSVSICQRLMYQVSSPNLAVDRDTACLQPALFSLIQRDDQEKPAISPALTFAFIIWIRDPITSTIPLLWY